MVRHTSGVGSRSEALPSDSGCWVIANPVESSLIVVRGIGLALIAVGTLLIVLFVYLHRNRAV